MIGIRIDDALDEEGNHMPGQDSANVPPASGGRPDAPSESSGAPARRPFRILSLDGGGIMGAFGASVLSAFEEDCRHHTGKGLVDQFDMITGTSTGGIIAIGLGLGGTAEQILGLYRERGARIFPPASGLGGWLPGFFRNLLGPKYRPDELRRAIEGIVAAKTLADAKTRLVIPAYDASMGRVYLFKTPHVPPGDTRDADKLASDVALATSAAPTYFPAHPVKDRGIFVDGGVWANCPAMVGVVEAIEFCKQRLEDLRVLSISTTSYPFRLSAKQQQGGLAGWGPKIIETFMFGQVQNAVAQATCLLRERFIRVDYETEPGIYAMDDARAVEELITAGRNIGQSKSHREAFQKWFLRAPGEVSTWPAVPRAGS